VILSFEWALKTENGEPEKSSGNFLDKIHVGFNWNKSRIIHFIFGITCTSRPTYREIGEETNDSHKKTHDRNEQGLPVEETEEELRRLGEGLS
jgi:hypothetical protein